MPAELRSEDIDRALSALNHEFGRSEMLMSLAPIRFMAAGGLVAVKYFDVRETTTDIDCFADPNVDRAEKYRGEIMDAVERVAETLGLDAGWFNDKLKVFIKAEKRLELFLQSVSQGIIIFKGPNLEVYAAPIEWQLECKLCRIQACTATRDIFLDVLDALALIKHKKGDGPPLARESCIDEEAFLPERYTFFNIDELKKAAAKSVGAEKCVSVVELSDPETEPDYICTKVFRLVMDDGSAVIARITDSYHNPARLTTASMVATMDFASHILGIPVPKVIVWNADADNPVQSEYIIMEPAAGMQSSKVWSKLSLPEKKMIVKQFVEMEKKMLSVSFTRYGSLYFADERFPGCVEAEVREAPSASLAAEIESRYVIGPVADIEVCWHRERKNNSINRGPWKRPEDYLHAIVRRGMAWLLQQAIKRSPDESSNDIDSLSLLGHNLALCGKFDKVVEYLLPKNRALVRSTIWHQDLDHHNVFIEGGKISGIIDWENVWARPLLLQALWFPKVIDFQDEWRRELEQPYGARCIQREHQTSILNRMYLRDTKSENQLLHEVYEFPYGRTISEVVSSSWNFDFEDLQAYLIDIQTNWAEICPELACPIEFTEGELEFPECEFELPEGASKEWRKLEPLMKDNMSDMKESDWERPHEFRDDGWTSNKGYDSACDFLINECREGLGRLKGEEWAQAERVTR
ncbi:hypothetical protein O1611_g3135 [Lasiodiplodia mahajangana]|uniref:Uncharacterized protein n=1 Tax=Lasiodiplodia mahajangana TaxID=1108764 RepID=A0ACC2JSL8_9PEZI|nr:hypothetical protein O1611_g3135 [Lasiodiplodia mahajangana]